MKFYGTNETVWDKENGRQLCKFVKREYETDDPRIIHILKELGYRSDEDAETEQGQGEDGPPERRQAKAEPTYQELRKQAKEKGIKGYGKMKMPELIEALKEGE